MTEREPVDDAAGTITDATGPGDSVLVVGSVPAELHRRACVPLFGTEATPPRRRVFARIGDRAPPIGDRLASAASGDPDHLVVVASDYRTRGAAAHDPTTDGSGLAPDRRRVDGDDLPLLTETVVGAVDDLATAAGGEYAPGELRVCVDDLTPLLVEHGDGDVVKFCHVVAKRVERSGGFGHVHLWLPTDDSRVSALEPAFDGVVELGFVDGVPHHRWRTRGAENSPWTPL